MSRSDYSTVAEANRKRVWSEESRQKLAEKKRKWHAERGHKSRDESAAEARQRIQDKRERQERLIRECGGNWVLMEIRPPGYYWVYVVRHPAYGTRWVRRSHLVATDKIIGAKVPKGHVVHHRNKCRVDDSPENLEVLTKEEHDRIHGDERLGREPWNKGKTQTAEHRAKIGMASRGRTLPDEARARISEFAKNRQDLGKNEKGQYVSKKPAADAS